MSKAENYLEIIEGKTSLGIELGSTRIKAVLVNSENLPIATGNFDWENSFIDGIWTFPIEEIKNGFSKCYSSIKKDIKEKYGVTVTSYKSIGISAMMHGYIAVNKNNELLTHFRTWRNNFTDTESEFLMDLFDYPIPQRWTISHLYQSINTNEKYLNDLDYVSTLSSYVHRLLTDEKVVGIGDASGMFPIDINTKSYNKKMVNKFNKLIEKNDFNWTLEDIFPKVLCAGEIAGYLTKKGALLLDVEGDLKPGIPLCPPEGDAGTGMVATNSVVERTGNVSAGTSVFSMIVLEKELKQTHKEIDLVTTPDGKLVAMAHSNNCTSEYDNWINLFNEVLLTTGVNISKKDLYEKLLNSALEGDSDCGGLLAYGYISGEHVTKFSEGRPLFVRHPNANFTLPNFMRTQLFTALCAMRVGLNILYDEEGVKIDSINGHGGFFKTSNVGATIMGAAMKTPVSVLSTAGEGGAWGIAILASYLVNNSKNNDLSTFLNTKIFEKDDKKTVVPVKEDIEGFNAFFDSYINGLSIEREAVNKIKRN